MQRLARGEGYVTCAVDAIGLFHQVRQAVSFDLFAVGVERERPEPLELDAGVCPLVLLAPLSSPGAAARYRVAFPDAVLVDRGLRDPDALRGLLGGGRPVEPEVTGVEAVRQAFGSFGLSERQLEVLSSALVGETSRSIAAKLFISELTVRNHLHAIYERVGVSGRRELLGRFVQGLIEGHA